MTTSQTPAKPRPTQQERRAITRARLLEAAADLFAQHGIDGVSVDAVAAAAGRTSGAVYDHFGSKHGLLLALLDDWSSALVAVIAAQFEMSENMSDRLGAVWENVCANPTDDVRRLFMLEHELWLRAARDRRLGSAMRSRTRESNDRVAKGLSAWHSAGRVKLRMTADASAALLKAVVIGLHMQLLADPEAVDRQSALDTIGTIVGVPRVLPAENDRQSRVDNEQNK